MDGIPFPVGNSLITAHVNALVDASSAPDVQPTPQMYASLRRDSNVIEAWDSDGNAATTDVVYKTIRVCTDFKIFGDSGVSNSPARYVDAPGTACYKYNNWCLGGREFFDLSTDAYEVGLVGFGFGNNRLRPGRKKGFGYA
mgnify:CR=1 FL=1